MENIQIEEKCLYKQLDTGIHELIFQDSSRTALDDMYIHCTNILENSRGETILFLIDYRVSGVPPLRYSIERTKAYLQKYSHLDNKARTAHLHKGGMMISLLQSFMGLLGDRVSHKFFEENQREEAITWLLG